MARQVNHLDCGAPVSHCDSRCEVCRYNPMREGYGNTVVYYTAKEELSNTLSKKERK